MRRRKRKVVFFYFISNNDIDYLSLYIASGNLSSKNRTFEFFAVPSKFLKFFLHNINKHYDILQIHCINHDYSWIILIFHENEFFHHFDIKFRLLRNFLDYAWVKSKLRRRVVKLIELPSVWYIYVDYSSFLGAAGVKCSKNRTSRFPNVLWNFMAFFLCYFNYYHKSNKMHCINHEYSWIFVIFH